MNKRIATVAVFCAMGVIVAGYAVSGPIALPDVLHTVKSMSLLDDTNTAGCTDQPIISGLDKAKDPSLRLLAQYQTLCKSGVTKTVVLQATKNSTGLAAALQEYARYGIDPIIFDSSETGAGNLATLKQVGITEEQIGTWIPRFAASNDFSSRVNDYARTAREIYPSLKIDVLFDSQFSPSALKEIQKNLLHAVGFESLINNDKILDPETMRSIATTLGVQSVWLSARTPPDVNASEHTKLLQRITNNAVLLKKSGLSVSIHLQADLTNTETVPRDFASQWYDAGIGLWLSPLR